MEPIYLSFIEERREDFVLGIGRLEGKLKGKIGEGLKLEEVYIIISKKDFDPFEVDILAALETMHKIAQKPYKKSLNLHGTIYEQIEEEDYQRLSELIGL